MPNPLNHLQIETVFIFPLHERRNFIQVNAQQEQILGVRKSSECSIKNGLGQVCLNRSCENLVYAMHLFHILQSSGQGDGLKELCITRHAVPLFFPLTLN